ncbi:MAG: carbonic anhydrase [Cyanobacteria bacterium]|nr:carbonic anhydrase [Cyanobacteriota bacterium]
MALDRRSFLLKSCLATAGLLGLGQAPARGSEVTTAADLGERDRGNDPWQVCRPRDPLQALLAGNARFAKAWKAADAAASQRQRARILSRPWEHNCYTSARELSGGQEPWAAILACADSRVAPEWIFDAALSDLFVIRSAGNTAFTAAVGSLEYDVGHLGIPLILVVGHSGCGAVQAARSADALSPNLSELVQPIRSSLTAGEDLNQAVRANARQTASQLTQNSELLRGAQAAGTLTIRSSFYDIQSGELSLI